MSEFVQKLDTHVSPADWDKQATLLQMPVADLKAKVAAVYEGMAKDRAVAEPQLILAEARPADGNWSQEFEIGFLDVFAIKGKLEITGTTATDWKANLSFTLKIFGVEAGNYAYQLDARRSGITLELNFLNLAKVSIGFSVGIDELLRDITLRLKGSAAYYDFTIWNWRSADFDIEVLRFPMPVR